MAFTQTHLLARNTTPKKLKAPSCTSLTQTGEGCAFTFFRMNFERRTARLSSASECCKGLPQAHAHQYHILYCVQSCCVASTPKPYRLLIRLEMCTTIGASVALIMVYAKVLLL